MLDKGFIYSLACGFRRHGWEIDLKCQFLESYRDMELAVLSLTDGDPTGDGRQSVFAVPALVIVSCLLHRVL